MGGALAIAVALLSFLVPLAIPLFAQRWRSFFVVLVLAVLFFAWLTWDLQRAGSSTDDSHWIGAFLGGLMLTGFAAGALAKFVMLIGRPADPRGHER